MPSTYWSVRKSVPKVTSRTVREAYEEFRARNPHYRHNRFEGYGLEGYGATPEPVIAERRCRESDLIFTVNSYGALILNSTALFIADVDDADPTTRAEELARFGGFLFLVYKTFAGWRVICTSHAYDPRSRESENLLNALGSDPRYVKLCKQQGCYRARLTPKPWREAETRVVETLGFVGSGNQSNTDLLLALGLHDSLAGANAFEGLA